MKTPFIALTLAIVLVGCTQSTPLAPSAPSSVPSQPDTSSSAPVEVEAPISSEVERYLDYFLAHSYVGFLVGNVDRAGFADEQMAAFALSHFIAKSYEPGTTEYDPAVGFPKADMDDVTTKYFGVTPKNYENSKTTLLPSGNIGSTGWGGAAGLYLIHSLEPTENGRTQGLFYLVSLSIGENYLEAKERLLRGDFSAYPEVFLVTMVFTQEHDEEGGFLRFYSAVSEVAQPPYTLYIG